MENLAPPNVNILLVGLSGAEKLSVTSLVAEVVALAAQTQPKIKL